MKRDQLSSTKPVEKEFYQLSAKGYTIATCFTDRLDMIVSTFIWAVNRDEESIKVITELNTKYWEDYIYFSNAFDSLVEIMEVEKDDYLWDFYMRFITWWENWQYFTPIHISDLMWQLGWEVEPWKSVYDMCCGSGRMLLWAMKVNRDRYFVGQDLDRRCCLMCVINLFLNGLDGEVYRWNSLALKREEWRRFNFRFWMPYICKIGEDELTNKKEEVIDESLIPQEVTLF